MKPADLRTLIDAMDKRPWFAPVGEREWLYEDSVITNGKTARPVEPPQGGRVLVQANPSFPYRANLDGIVALANHGEALAELFDAAARWRATRERRRGDREAEQAETDMLAALAKLERLP